MITIPPTITIEEEISCGFTPHIQQCCKDQRVKSIHQLTCPRTMDLIKS